MGLRIVAGLFLFIAVTAARRFSWEPVHSNRWREGTYNNNRNSGSSQNQNGGNSFSSDSAPQQSSWSSAASSSSSSSSSWADDSSPQQSSSSQTSSSWSSTPNVWVEAPAPAPAQAAVPEKISVPSRSPPTVMGDGVCEWPGQYLPNSQDRCTYMQCDVDAQPWDDGNYRLVAKMRLCAPGTGTPEGYQGGTDNPCSARPAACAPKVAPSSGQTPTWSLSPATSSGNGQSNKDVMMMVVMNKGNNAPWSSNSAPIQMAPAPWSAAPVVSNPAPASWSSDPAPIQNEPAPWSPSPATSNPAPAPWSADPAPVLMAPAPWSSGPAPSNNDAGNMMVLVWSNDDSVPVSAPQQSSQSWSSNTGSSSPVSAPSVSSWQPQQQNAQVESNPKVMSVMKRMVQQMVSMMNNNNKNSY